MRDPARIGELLNLLNRFWLKNPDLRLTQILQLILGGGDHFYREDEEILKGIKLLLRSKGKNENRIR